MATSAGSPLEEHMTCSVCLEVYTNPQSLKCLHVFCQDCVQGLRQGNRVQCPNCREVTDVDEVKKDFNMEALISIQRNSTEDIAEHPSEAVCDVCDKSGKVIKSFCTNCKELLCVDCSVAHRGMKLTKTHIHIIFAELQKASSMAHHWLGEQLKLVRDAHRDIDNKCTNNREIIENIKQAEARQIVEVNRLSQSIIQDVETHHDGLIKEIQSVNQNVIEILAEQGQMLTDARQQLEDKFQHLSDMSQIQDYPLLIDILKNLCKEIKQDLAHICSGLPKRDQHAVSPVLVVKGEDWNPQKSTRIDLTSTTEAVDEAKRDFTPYTLNPWIDLSSHLQVQQSLKEIHSRYREETCVDIKRVPQKLCVYRDELWVGCGDKGVFVYNTDLEEIKHVKNSQFKYVTSLCVTDTDVIVCDSKTGLHLLNQQGDYLKLICSGQFSDVSFTNNRLYALEFKEGEIYVFSKSDSSWLQGIQFKLSSYSKGGFLDKLCTTDSCLFVSSFSNHCILVHSLTGKYLYTTGKFSGWSGEFEAGKFYNPLLSDVDSRERLLVCDLGNHRIQVFDPGPREWSELRGLHGLGRPGCAWVGHKHLWVGNFDKKLLKFVV